jgi:phosphohistidine phosphatase
MLSLMLLRHAKSSWDDPARKDFDRPLTARGKLAAARMGAYMARQGLAPDLIVSSSAVRARQTLALVLPHLGDKPRTEFAEGLYLATPAALLSRLRKVGAAADSVMIVGHNPGMHSLAVTLSGSGDAGSLKALAAKFPTAALAVITFEARNWSRIGPATGRLAEFMTPKRLP